MSVFLRWGVFGILGVAALLYAYNASKRMAESHAAKQAAVQAAAPAAPAPARETVVEEAAAEEAAPAPATSEPAAAPVRAQCEAELQVAQRAIEMRKQGAPLDRVLRIQEIAWQEQPKQRQRLEMVATRWFGYEGDFAPAALRIAVINDCEQALQAPTAP